MANSSQSGNILGYASGTQPGLVSTVAQTFAGKKTLDGGALIAGDTSGVAIASGYIGQTINGTIAATTAYTSGTVLNLGSITLNKGLYLINCLAYVTTGATTIFQVFRRGLSTANNTLTAGNWQGGMDNYTGSDQAGQFIQVKLISADSTQLFFNGLCYFTTSTATHSQSNSFLQALRIA